MKSPRQDDPATGGESVGRDNSIPLGYFLLVTLGAASRSLRALAANYWQLVHPERILLVTAVVAALSCLTLWTLVKVGVSRKVALLTVLAATLLFVGGGPILRRLGSPLGWLVVIGAVVMAILLARAFSETVILGAAAVIVVALVSGGLLSGYETVRSMGADNTVNSESLSVELIETPDIYLLFFDAYAGFPALLDLLGTPKEGIVGDLESGGFDLPTSAWTSYASTDMAIPSVLDMSYPVTPDVLTNAGRATLHTTIAGDNRTVSLLRENGYRTTMVESGWVGSSCGPEVDECIASHWVDEVMFHLSSESLLYEVVLERFGHAFTANSIHTIDEIKKVASRSDSEEPRFVFAHILAPHPPFFLNEDCEVAVDSDRVTRSYSQDPADEVWDAFFLEQTQCVDSMIGDLLDVIPADAVVILSGDHGVGRHPSTTGMERPSPEVILEQQNVFLAVRSGDECELTDPILTSDLMRQVLSCYSVTPLPPVDQRMFVRGGYEMTPTEIEELTGNWVPEG